MSSYRHGLSSARINFLLGLFIATVLMIEVNYLFSSLNIGNLVVFFGAATVVAVFLVYGQSRYLLHTFLIVDFVIAILLGILFLLSTLWSESPTDSFVQSVYFLFILFSCYLLRAVSISVLVRYVLHGALCICILSLVALLINNSYALQPFPSTWLPELRGIFKHQQRLGLFICFSLGIALIAIINRENGVFIRGGRYKWWFVSLLVFVVMFSFARLFIFFSVIAFIITLLIGKSLFWRWLVLFGFTAFAVLLYRFNAFALVLDSYASGELSLSGRLMVWERTYQEALLQPFLGFGYSSFNSIYFDSLWSGFYRPPHAHNSFLQVFFDVGLIGLFAMVVLIFSQFNTISGFVKGRVSYSMFALCQVFLTSLTGVTYAGKPSILYALLFLFIAVEGEWLRRSRKI